MKKIELKKNEYFFIHKLQHVLGAHRDPEHVFHAGGDFCRLLITFANSLDPNQARQNVGPDLDPNCLTL